VAETLMALDAEETTPGTLAERFRNQHPRLDQATPTRHPG